MSRIIIKERGDVRHVIVANDAKLNTLNSPLLEALAEAFAVGPDTRAVVLARAIRFLMKVVLPVPGGPIRMSTVASEFR